ncbi:uncharacterized protein EDB93DRAFT_455221 [Suillus bovinus]|uniref:uncharacterized protein n=1 Tax=Suillus bovinus TaxID=48563 RepID=UPI001B8620D9|nr:uncharacterized protein EDB93DRAFT_455221 [Suillus bovinus]KAG2146898.1 hypothetical protein EDB93DRAFT_455221 [Suillus bovinus]
MAWCWLGAYFVVFGHSNEKKLRNLLDFEKRISFYKIQGLENQFTSGRVILGKSFTARDDHSDSPHKSYHYTVRNAQTYRPEPYHLLPAVSTRSYHKGYRS